MFQGTGVVSDLGVVAAEKGTVTVAAGFVLDPCGREIVVWRGVAACDPGLRRTRHLPAVADEETDRGTIRETYELVASTLAAGASCCAGRCGGRRHHRGWCLARGIVRATGRCATADSLRIASDDCRVHDQVGSVLPQTKSHSLPLPAAISTVVSRGRRVVLQRSSLRVQKSSFGLGPTDD
jgi:hypothetical protein